jgi:glucans biosynthesis protein
MRRRALLAGSAALPVFLLGVPGLPTAAPPQAATSFDSNTVRNIARALAAKPFQPPDTKLPDAIAHLTYDQYRTIRFDPAHSLWRGQHLYFQVEFFHLGFLYNERVDMFEVADGKAVPLVYSPDLFDLGVVPSPPPGTDLGFAGFRIHAPINRADYYDEFCVFLGASYFRAVAKGQGYGLSARGLAINTGDPKGEEFPTFRKFWLERPPPGAQVLVVHALLDSVSTTGAYRFTIRPGEQTIFDVEATLFPRVDIPGIGLGPMTSMFDFDASDRANIDDYRNAVHDSGGLAIWTGHGEHVWRPLANPRTLQVSAFGDTGGRGFGLMQRKRAFADYDDLEAHYEKRPSLWVEPIGDPGEGAVMLIEIPTKREINDNIVAFWRPKQPPKAQSEFGLTYRLHWCNLDPFGAEVARVIDTRSGIAFDGKGREFIVDFLGGRLAALAADAKPKLEVSADHGSVSHAVAQPNPETGGWRIAFELDTDGAPAIELRAVLSDAQGALGETWLYRWTP